MHPAAGRASRNRVPGLPPPTAAARAGADAAGLLAEIRRQRHTGQSRIVAAPDAPGRARPRPRQLRSRRHGLRPAVPGRAQDPHRRAGLDRRPPRALDRPHPKHTPAHRPPTASKPGQGPPDQAAPVRSDQTHPLTERRTGGQNGLSVRPHRQACRSQRATISAGRIRGASTRVLLTRFRGGLGVASEPGTRPDPRVGRCRSGCPVTGLPAGSQFLAPTGAAGLICPVLPEAGVHGSDGQRVRAIPQP